MDLWHCICAILLMQSVRDVLRQSLLCSASVLIQTMQSVRDVLRQRNSVLTRGGGGDEMQSVRDVLRQSFAQALGGSLR